MDLTKRKHISLLILPWEKETIRWKFFISKFFPKKMQWEGADEWLTPFRTTWQFLSPLHLHLLANISFRVLFRSFRDLCLCLVKSIFLWSYLSICFFVLLDASTILHLPFSCLPIPLFLLVPFGLYLRFPTCYIVPFAFVLHMVLFLQWCIFHWFQHQTTPHSAYRVYLYVLYDSHKKRRLFP